MKSYSFPQLLLFVDLINDRWNREVEARKKAERDADLKARGVKVKQSYRDNLLTGQKMIQKPGKKKRVKT